MPHNDKLSQRRLLLFDQQFSRRFRSMAAIDSGDTQKVAAMPPEQVAGMARNGWPTSVGITGRHGPDYASEQGEKEK